MSQTPMPYQTPSAMPYGQSPSLLAPSPMDIGGLFSSSLAILKRRWALMAGIVAVQSLVLVGSIIPLMAIIGWQMWTLVGDGVDPTPSEVLASLPWFALGTLVTVGLSWWTQVHFGAKMVAAVDQTANGQDATWSSASRQARGAARRALPLLLIGVAVMVGLWVVLGLLMAVIARAAEQSDGAAAGVFILLPLLMIVMYPTIIYFSLRWVYTLTLLGTEPEVSGLGLLRRSWELTRNRFWATLGNLLIGMLIPYVVMTIAQSLFSGLLVPFLPTTDPDSPSEPELSAGLVVALLIYLLVQMVLSIGMLLWQTTWTTVMYRDQVNRKQMPQGWGAWPGQVAAPQWQPQSPQVGQTGAPQWDPWTQPTQPPQQPGPWGQNGQNGQGGNPSW